MKSAILAFIINSIFGYTSYGKFWHEHGFTYNIPNNYHLSKSNLVQITVYN